MDKLEQKLAKHSQVFGIPMRCEWQGDIDARVDLAPKELKFVYGEMLAGYDLVRYLLESEHLEVREEALRSLLVKVIATQWERDAKVKFKQVELDSHNLVDLFVDVEARQISVPSSTGSRRLPAGGRLSGHNAEDLIVGGAAQYVLREQKPLTLIRGEPGQGKSTLGQFVCQLHRAAYLGREPFVGDTGQFMVFVPRLSLRLDLKDYAAWVEGGHPYSTSDSASTTRPRKPVNSSLETFLAYFLGAQSGGLTATVETVNEILNRFPLLIVLDGLDEVARSSVRSQTVTEIDAFAARLATNRISPQLIVTTRPNSSGLPEPSAELFDVLALVRLSPELRTEYLRKWTDARSIHSTERQALQRTFDHRSAEPHIAQLAESPMHLAILLYLMYKRGESVPSRRTDLYRSYMETFLDRETEKSPTVRALRSDLEEVTAFLGWHLHSTAESQDAVARMTVKAIKRAINGHLYAIGKDASSLDELFTGVTDRVWALTSKVQGTFEFDVQSVQEYFAAKYLYEVADATGTGGQSALLGHMLRRPFWGNTARFYAGFANTNELPALLEGLQEQLERGDHPGQIRQGVWSLLADGVFTRRPRTQRNTVALLRDDLSVRLLTFALGTDGYPVVLSADRGGADLVEMLLQDVAVAPGGPLSAERMRLVHWLQPDREAFRTWWLPHINKALGTSSEVAWLQVSILWQGGQYLGAEQAERLALSDVRAPSTALAAGVSAAPNSPLERRLVAAVLDGLCSERSKEHVSGFAGDLLKVLDPHYFLTSDLGTNLPIQAFRNRHPVWASPTQRAEAWQRLIGRDARFEKVQAACLFSEEREGTAWPWDGISRELSAIFGPCWLAAEIAVIGAVISRSHKTSNGDFPDDSQPLGSEPGYGRLLQGLHGSHSNADWWRDQLDALQDPLSRGVWALALLSVADGSVVHGLLAEFDTVVRALPPMVATALTLSSSRLATSFINRRLSTQILSDTAQLSALTSLLIAHHEDASLERRPPDGLLTTQRLKEMAEYGVAAWPVHGALTARMAQDPTSEHLDALSALGPANPGAADIWSAADSRAVTGMRLPDEHVKTILQHPARYPLPWVNIADLRMSQQDRAPLLDQVAQDEDWFGL